MYKEPIGFINEFSKGHYCETSDIFMGGYCYYFAHILRIAFERGAVCWAAPFAHMVWVDTDGTAYDIDGVYCGEAFYFIPESYLTEEEIESFKHSKIMEPIIYRDRLIKTMRQYCKSANIDYQIDVENYFRKGY